jgi:lysophospholipid acyltransferase (LPLAT)-like uncharacterized protein
MNKLDRKKILFLLASKLAWLLILLFGKTGRITARNRKVWDRLVKSGQPMIALLWHGKMLLPMYWHRHENLSVMISEHQDGELIAQNVKRLGYRTVRGSSTRGGSKAFRQMLKQLKNGDICVILPDGPRGPRQYVKLGAILLAQITDAYILPITFSAGRPVTLKTWDRFTFWWPFSKLCIVYGEPLQIPRRLNEQELEEYRLMVEKQMFMLQEKADAIF